MFVLAFCGIVFLSFLGKDRGSVSFVVFLSRQRYGGSVILFGVMFFEERCDFRS